MTDSSLRYYRTGIPTLDGLLMSDDGKLAKPSSATGLAYHESVGFFGTVFGSAGSGKSILALQLASLCANASSTRGIFERNGDSVKDVKYSAIYITQESVDLVREKIRGFEWIEDSAIRTPKDPLFLNLKIPALHLAQFNLTRESQADILRNIFDAVVQGDGPNSSDFILICFDNAETILQAAYTDVLGATFADKNFYKGIRDFCRHRRLHLLMYFEDPERGSFYRSENGEGNSENGPSNDLRTDVSTSTQAYAADLVIRLGSHVFATGYKERSIEIVKAKNQFHRRGTHHFSIVPFISSDMSSGFRIYESLATQLHKLRIAPISENDPNNVSRSHIGSNLGIRTLDERISRLAISRGSNGTVPYLSPGSISVLVCDLDVRAQEIALHFAFRPQEVDRLSESSNEAVYISFLNSWNTLSSVLGRFQKSPVPAEPPSGFLPLDPEHISEGKLLQDISTHIQKCIGRMKPSSPLRVVLDNLYALEAKFPLIQNTSHFITALFAQLRSLGTTTLVVDTVEVGVGRNPLDQSFAAGLGQNVFLLRHVELHSRSHTAFSVVQLLEHVTPDTLWEIVRVDGSLQAQDTFKYYKNVLTGAPEQVTVNMSVHADAKHSPLDIYIRDKTSALRHSLGYRLKVQQYRPEHYAHVHGAFSFARQQPFSDCHVISIDETWLEDLISRGDVEELSQGGRYEGAVTTCHDLALSYVGKKNGDESVYQKTFAIPERNNCGALLVGDDNGLKPLRVYELCKAWRDDTKKTWESFVTLKKAYVAEVTAKRSPNKSDEFSKDPVFFTFCRDQAESCVSFLLELALCCVPKGRNLVSNRTITFFSRKNSPRPWVEALKLFVQLLEVDDQREIAEGIFRSSIHDPFAIFSRQWINTCFVTRADIRERGSEDTEAFNRGHQSTVGAISSAGAYYRRRRPVFIELPGGIRGFPGVVSGAWYFGILKGSAAIEAGIEAIRQFTSPKKDSPGEDLRKANLGLGLPVRVEFYQPGGDFELLDVLPYRARFAKIGQNDLEFESGKDRIQLIARTCETEHPFYRIRINAYRDVMPIMWGMMVRAARICRSDGSGSYVLDDDDAVAICRRAQDRYVALMKQLGCPD